MSSDRSYPVPISTSVSNFTRFWYRSPFATQLYDLSWSNSLHLWPYYRIFKFQPSVFKVLFSLLPLCHYRPFWSRPQLPNRNTCSLTYFLPGPQGGLNRVSPSHRTDFRKLLNVVSVHKRQKFKKQIQMMETYSVLYKILYHLWLTPVLSDCFETIDLVPSVFTVPSESYSTNLIHAYCVS